MTCSQLSSTNKKLHAGDRLGHRVRGDCSGFEAEPKYASDGRGDNVRIHQRCELDEPYPVVKPVEDAARDLQRKCRLPNPSWPCQADDPIGGNEILSTSGCRRIGRRDA